MFNISDNKFVKNSRFIINIPEADKNDIVRICFQVELAHWFYTDFYCNTEELLNISFYDFALQIFKNIPFLDHNISDLSNILSDWRAYKQAVPTYGAIIMNSDLSEVLLVQSYFSKNSWGFPKGKINENETPVKCAIREVNEEIGFDISGHIDPESYIEVTKNDQIIRLYVITHISKETKFAPQTRCEIKNIEWFKIKDLPLRRKHALSKFERNGDTLKFFMVVPFMRRLRRFVANKNVNQGAAKCWLKFSFDRDQLNQCFLF